jgi:O-antigen/teichoic acid export membrane protein
MTLAEAKPSATHRSRRSPAHLLQSSLLRNSGFLMVTTIFTAGLGYLYWVIAARGYDARTVGLATALIAGQSFTAMVCCLGIDALLIQVLPKLVDDIEWSTMVTVGVGVGVAMSAFVASGVALALPSISSHYVILHHPAEFILFVAGSALGTGGTITDSVFISSRRSEKMLVRNLTFGLVKLPIMVIPLAFSDHPGVFIILFSWVIANATSLILAYGFQMRRLRPHYRPAVRHGPARLVRARAHILSHFLTNVGSQTPPFLLPLIVVALVSPQANAYFYLTWSVGGVFLIISPAIASSLFAEGSNAQDLVANTRKSVYFIAVLLTPMILGAIFLSHRVLLLFGPEYARQGSTLLRVLALSAIPDAITNIYVSVERVRGRLARVAALNVTMAIIAVGLTVAVVRHDGVSGPGFAWLIAQGAGAALVLYPVVRTIVRPGSAPAPPTPSGQPAPLLADQGEWAHGAEAAVMVAAVPDHGGHLSPFQPTRPAPSSGSSASGREWNRS